VEVKPGEVKAQGPKGGHSVPVRSEIKVVHDATAGVLKVERVGESKLAHALHGTIRAHLANLMQGVTQGFEKTLEISGGGYNAKVAAGKLTLNLGYTHPIEVDVPKELVVECPSVVSVVVRGCDRQKVGQFAAEVRMKRPVEPYNLKGIKYRGEVVKKKAGKAAVGATK
jgi:large subunit ribosomal protein L6